MKLSFQICNSAHPNSVTNTCVFVAFEAGDSRCNLHIAMDRYHAQVQDLKGLIWRFGGNYSSTNNQNVTYRNSAGEVFTTRIFFSGDYEFLCYMYGLSGASGTFKYMTYIEL